jgi:DNA-3-methyladenine glycosylase I
VTRSGLVKGPDGLRRCWWPGADEDYRRYHDLEWGRPVCDDRRLFEKVSLEGFQAGLAWITILRKRDAFRRAFRDFDFEAIARFNRRSVERLLRDPGIVRHRGKIESVVHNARRACELVDEFGSLASYFWRFEPGPLARPRRVTRAALAKLARTPESEAMTRDLRRRGWKFVGPTTLYAFMQAMGLVNDHIEGCAFRAPVEDARRRFRRPVTALRPGAGDSKRAPPSGRHRNAPRAGKRCCPGRGSAPRR